MAQRPIEELPPHDRRRFFAAGVGRMLGPLVQYLEDRFPHLLPQDRTLMRPPGALPENAFLETCLRCGQCADACPAHAIALHPPAGEPIDGTPFVDANVAACVVCDELACMKACPSGALRLVGRLEIRMGLAVVDHTKCLRSNDEDCRICIDRCPLGATAIRIEDGRVRVLAPEDDPENGRLGEGCVGCGVCQLYCPTRPRAIIVTPT
ncbi:MAG: 4Fe-4S dicluster domain-containing protein [Phycisphaerae bacterium]|nr:4Fe-4S dicluster domain-containing protein [Phycisphaerae bacterium]NUQ44634.1 4Fe-4S dicluster domain-containing protein [Phycisphaerae bacterium]